MTTVAVIVCSASAPIPGSYIVAQYLQFTKVVRSIILFRSLVLELGFLVTESHIDISKEKGYGLIDYHDAFSIHLHNAAMMG